MITILNIETSTDICSVSIAIDGVTKTSKISSSDRSHAKILGKFIESILDENNISAKNLDAVAISSGPGSYTGLRIGTSTAKGICYGQNIPLIAIDTLKIMAKMACQKIDNIPENAKIIPMLDARRDEVYSAVFDNNLNKITDTQAIILNSNSYSDIKGNPIYICGNGAEKSISLVKFPNYNHINQIYPSAEYMGNFSFEAYNKKDFVDVIYFEPFYLKSVFITTPKNKVLNQN